VGQAVRETSPAPLQTESTQPVRSAALRFRLGTPTDFAQCEELLPPGFRASRAVRRELSGCWSKLLAEESRTFAIIEDLERAYPAGIEGFGLSVFVSDRFMAEFCGAPQPYLAAIFYERLLAGEDIVLSPEQLARANATTGINVLVLHFGLRNHNLFRCAYDAGPGRRKRIIFLLSQWLPDRCGDQRSFWRT
jgi:hypothetical protein